MKVLVVDDAPDIRRVLAILLRRLGHDTFEAGDGVEAMNLLQQESVDAVITDFRMPRMDGLELLRRLEGRDLHKAMLTAYPNVDLQRSAQELGAKFLTKPIDPHAIAQVFT